jgi:hypothetical protein
MGCQPGFAIHASVQTLTVIGGAVAAFHSGGPLNLPGDAVGAADFVEEADGQQAVGNAIAEGLLTLDRCSGRTG